VGTIWTTERRFFFYLLLIQALIVVTLYLALSSPRALDTLTSEKTVRGVTTEAPVDRYTGVVLATAAVCSLVAVLLVNRRTGRVSKLWLSYSSLLAVGAFEEADWLRALRGQDVRVAGWPIGSLHDLLEKLNHDLRGESADYVLSSSVVLILLAVTSAIMVWLMWQISTNDELLDMRLLVLISIGVFLGGAGLLIDADILPKPTGIDWKAHIEEPLEAIGAVCLLIVSLEGLGRAATQRIGF
jgi:hypothetical protein